MKFEKVHFLRKWFSKKSTSLKFKFIFLENGSERFFSSERDCDWIPPLEMSPNIFFVATLSRDVHWDVHNQITIQSAGANPL